MISCFIMPPSYCYLLLCFIAVFTNIHTSSAYSFSSPVVSYKDHCASIVPESSPTHISYNISTPLLVTNYYTGGDQILGLRPSEKPHSYITKSLKLEITSHSETISVGIHKLEALLLIRSPYHYYPNTKTNSFHGFYNSRSDSITFSLNGFWSKYSRELCMVGSAFLPSMEGQVTNFDAVLKIKFADMNPTIITSVDSGVLESTSQANQTGYFHPLLIFDFPDLPDYKYSLVSHEVDKGFSGDADSAEEESISLLPNMFCSMLSGSYFMFELRYPRDCEASRNCSPLGEGGHGFLPSFMSLDLIKCSQEEQKVRYVLKFRNITRGVFRQDFDASWTLIGEGSWDDKKSKLLVAACRISNPDEKLENGVKDCSIRLSLRYPSTWNITNNAKIVGQLWTNGTANDSAYFRKIELISSDENDMVVYPGLRYKYSKLDRVQESCQKKKVVGKERKKYPDGHSNDMKFDIFVRNSKGQPFAWGNAAPLSVGNDFYQKYPSAEKSDQKTIAPLNISYIIGIRKNYFRKVKLDNWSPTLNLSVNLRSRVEITAEGVYDAETGHLCMVGCRKLLSYNYHRSTAYTTDCEILVIFEFAHLNGKKGALIKGTIRSTRQQQDPLYFEDLTLLSAAYYRAAAKKYVERINLEIAMFLISSTLVCVFVGTQLFHVKRNPDVLPFISLAMVLILCLGHMIPLVLNFEALFMGNRQKRGLSVNAGGWFEANEVSLRVVTMVAFLLQIRLLHLVWTARTRGEKGWLSEEKKAALISFLTYILGGMVTLLVNWARNSDGYSFWGILRSYSGLILDFILLPQSLLNAFRGSVEKALAVPFYIGMSMVRLVPHLYARYIGYSYGMYYVKGTRYYANPTGDFYSKAWDVAIPCGIVMLAVIVYLQQRYGGHCIFPRRFWKSGQYEEVPVVNNDAS